MSTLAVVEEILRETAVPMSVREIVERAGVRLPSKSETPDTVVARDLSMDIKKKGEGSLFIRTSPGRYTLRALAAQSTPAVTAAPTPTTIDQRVAPQPMSALATRKPAAAATPARELTVADNCMRFNSRGQVPDLAVPEFIPLVSSAGRKDVRVNRLGSVRVQ